MSLVLMGHPPGWKLFHDSRRVNPTVNSGWESYLNGSRLFPPGATNIFIYPNLVENGSTGKYTGMGETGQHLHNTPVFDVLPNGDGTFCQEVTYTVHADDLAGAGHTIGVWYGGGDAGNVSGGDPLCLSMEYQLIASNVRSIGVGGFGTVNQAYGEGIATPIPAANTVGWTPLSVIGTCGGGDTQRFLWMEPFAINNATGAAGDTITFRMRHVSMVKSSILTPFFSGDSPDCSWSGTPNASVSVRTGSALTVPVVVGTTGTVAARVTTLYAGNDGAAHKVLDGPANYFILRKSSANNWRLEGEAGDDWIQSAPLTFAAGSTHTLVGRWAQGVSLDLNYDGTDVAQYANAFAFTPQTTLRIGGSYEDACAYIGPVLISPQRKSDAWVAAIQADDGAAFDDPLYLFDHFMAVDDLLLPLSSNSIGYLKTSSQRTKEYDSGYAFTTVNPTTDTGWETYS